MRPTRRDLALGAPWGAALALLATRALPPNPVLPGLEIVGTYLVAYVFSTIILAWFLRLAFSRLPRGARLAPALAFTVAALGAWARGSVEQPKDVAVLAVAAVAGFTPWGAAAATLIGAGILAERAAAPSFEGEPVALPSAKPGAPVVIFGMDGLDLDLVDRFVGEGRLPNFRRVLAEGSSAKMKTVSPHSPIVWTSIATSRRPSAHGIAGYTSAWLRGTSVLLPHDPLDLLGSGVNRLAPFRQEGAVSSRERRVPALWEVASRSGRRTLVVNWWASYPAEPIDGVMVSNHAIPWSRFDAASRAEVAANAGAVSPAAMQTTVAGVVDRVVAETGADALVRDPKTRDGSVFFSTRDDIVLALYAALDGPSFPLVMLYTQDTDTASHVHSEYVFGANLDKKRKPRVSKAEAEASWKALVVAAYERQDARLGTLLAELPAGAGLLVVSDHGWEYNGRSHWRKPDGTFLAWGGPFGAAGRLGRVDVLDVLPTAAAANGLPIAKDLAGKAVAEAFSGGMPPLLEVPTYGPRAHLDAPDVAAQEDDAHIERLRALGYVE